MAKTRRIEGDTVLPCIQCGGTHCYPIGHAREIERLRHQLDRIVEQAKDSEQSRLRGFVLGLTALDRRSDA